LDVDDNRQDLGGAQLCHQLLFRLDSHATVDLMRGRGAGERERASPSEELVRVGIGGPPLPFPAWAGLPPARARARARPSSACSQPPMLHPSPRVARVTLTSEPHEKLPASRRSARNLKAPPRTRTRRTVTLDDSLVMAGWRPSSYLGGG
jgi:hypothetical protein